MRLQNAGANPCVAAWLLVVSSLGRSSKGIKRHNFSWMEILECRIY